MNLNWKKFPEATHYSPARDGNHAGFWRMVGDKPVKLWCQELAGGEFTEYNNPTMFESDRDRLIARPAESWTGEGLPPVGIEIEAFMRRNMHDEYAWRRVKVAHGCIPGSEGEVLVFDLETTSPAWVDEFRPIRTPEQVAADAREKAVREVYDSCNGQGRSVLEMLGEAYDAGRKQAAS